MLNKLTLKTCADTFSWNDVGNNTRALHYTWFALHVVCTTKWFALHVVCTTSQALDLPPKEAAAFVLAYPAMLKFSHTKLADQVAALKNLLPLNVREVRC